MFEGEFDLIADEFVLLELNQDVQHDIHECLIEVHLLVHFCYLLHALWVELGTLVAEHQGLDHFQSHLHVAFGRLHQGVYDFVGPLEVIGPQTLFNRLILAFEIVEI